MKGVVRLRAVTAGDLSMFFEHQRDPDAVRMAAFPPRGLRAFMGHWKTLLRDAAVLKRTIVLDGNVAGNIVSWDHSGEREVGYWIGKEHWGKGVATRALAAFLREEPTRPLYAHVAKHNAASIRVLEKCGFAMVREEKGFAEIGGDSIDGLVFELR